MILQPIIDIAQLCAHKGLEQAIISPGSRSAPLTLAFARHPKIDVKMVGDERAAAFIANGIAQTSEKPVILACTSGSAAYNYAPAIAEAFFQEIPLLVFTADRPPEWIDQKDGQTIRQQNIYGSHVKRSYQLPVDLGHADSHWHVNRIINEAINLAVEAPYGPVHINVPFREPFYPKSNEDFAFSNEVRIISSTMSVKSLGEDEITNCLKHINNTTKVMLVVGQGHWEKEDVTSLIHFAEKFQIPVVADIISNIPEFDARISHQDAFLIKHMAEADDSLKPDLLITIGGAVISKQLKLYLRKFSPQEHWHIQESGDVADVFQGLTRVLRTQPGEFFKEVAAAAGQTEKENSQFISLWKSKQQKANALLNDLLSRSNWNEFKATWQVMNQLPENGQLHLANSMPVRYANYIGLRLEGIRVFANRGTSGIDGCTSTAVGAALACPDEIVTLITGDMAFFYDRNAFWYENLPSNLRVVIINNAGGGIFGLIDGPSAQPELEKYFITHQPLKAESMAKDFNLDYYCCEDITSLENTLPSFFKPDGKSKILELITDREVNTEFFTEFKNTVKRN